MRQATRFGARAALVLLALAGCDSSPSGVDDDRIRGGSPLMPIDIPSDDETVFAETRDFTVVGYFDPPLDAPGDVLVELFAGTSTDGTPLRVVRSHVDPATGVTPRASLDFSYAAGQAFGPHGPITDTGAMVMSPDLVAVPGGIEDPTNKVVVTREYYAAVVLGGVSSAFDTEYADAGVPWVDLTAGTYTLRVTGLSGDVEGLRSTKRIEFGRTHAMLGRFAPEPQRDALLSFATANGYRTYIDFFPGFFSHGGYAFEIPARWMANNSIEVVNVQPSSIVDRVAVARNDVLLYNISATSATQLVEIGTIVAHGLVRQTGFHRYDIGEPSLTWTDAGSGMQRSLTGTIVGFEACDRLAVTRVEIRDAAAVDGDNHYDVGDSTPVTIDVDPYDGVSGRVRQTLSIHGVVTPIASSTGPGPLAHQYRIDDAIAQVSYVIRDSAGVALDSFVRPIGLDRRYDVQAAPGRVSTSVYEFEHEVSAGTDPGAFTIVLTGLDVAGEAVPGTVDSIAVVIDAPQAVRRLEPGRPAPAQEARPGTGARARDPSPGESPSPTTCPM